MRTTILFGLILVSALLIGCSAQVAEEKQIDSFDVELLVVTSSSAGTRTLNVTYTVENGEIISCEGVNKLDLIGNKEEFPCDLETLKSEGYNIPYLITEIPENGHLEGEAVGGPVTQKWKIILK